jgi:hypothetical protein
LHYEHDVNVLRLTWLRIVLLKGFAALTHRLSLANSMPGT